MRMIRIDISFGRFYAECGDPGRYSRAAVTPPTVKKNDPSRNSGELPRRVSSGQLLVGSDRLLIEHQGECYTLRQTRNGKLILTK